MDRPAAGPAAHQHPVGDLHLARDGRRWRCHGAADAKGSVLNVAKWPCHDGNGDLTSARGTAPRSSALQCALQAADDRRVFTVYVPSRLNIGPGETLSVIVPGSSTFFGRVIPGAWLG